MLVAYVIFGMTFGYCVHPFAALAFYVLALGAAWVKWGYRQVFGFLGLADLFVPVPFMVVYFVAAGRPSLESGIHVVLYFVSLGLLLFRRRIPDGVLPLKGQWAQKAWVFLSLFGLVLAYLWPLVTFAVRAPQRFVQLQAPLLILSVLIPLYLWAAWDVLVRGWDPPDRRPAGGLRSGWK